MLSPTRWRKNRDLDALLESLYSVAADDQALPVFFDRLRGVTGAGHAGLFAGDPVTGARAHRREDETWAPRPDLLAFALPPGSVVGPASLEGPLPHCLALHLGVEDGLLTYLALANDPAAGPLPSQARWTLEWLAPHALRTLLLRRRIAQAAHWSGLLDQTLGAAWVVAKDAQILALTPTAKRWTAERRAIQADRGGRLAGADSTSTQSLREAVGRADGHPLVLPLPDGCLASVAALPGQEAVRVAALCPESLGQGAELLSTAYGLTPAERRLLQALMDHGNVSAAARALGITRDTAKTQMTSIFARTRTSRQAELVKLVCTIGLIARPGSF